jgi:hypothetical protein
MSTTPIGGGQALALGAERWSSREHVAGRSGAAAALIGALVALALYAAFADGAANLAGQAWLQGMVAVVAAVSAGGLVWTGSLRFVAPRRAVLGIGLLASFAAWNAISLGWSVAPDTTWTEFNRAVTYVIVLALAIVAGASRPDSVKLLGRGYLAVVLLVAAYAIGQKLVPGLHIGGLIDLNQPQSLPRLEEPLGYWNALGVFLAMGAPVALALAADRTAGRRLRLASLLGLEVVLLTLGLTYSRGALLALAVGLIVAVASGGSRLRSLLWLGSAAVAAVPPLVVAVVDSNLTGVHVPLGSREQGGVLLTIILAASMLVLRTAGTRVIAAEPRHTVGPERARRIGRALAALAAALLVAGVVAMAVSPRGLTGTISHAWHTFTATEGTSSYAPDRLLSVDSENRWVWWKEAVGAWSDRPFTGWGAGSFAVIQPRFSNGYLPVKQPHSVPLQFLAETGLIGAGLAIAGFGLLLAAGLGAVRRARAPDRALLAALLGAVTIYAVHTLYDWDWDIPGVTLPALLCLGVLVGHAADRRRGVDRYDSRRGIRTVALATVSLALCAVALSAVLPSVAASEAQSAVTLAASNASPSALAQADSKAILASRLDPLSDKALIVQADIATRYHQFRRALSDLQTAVRRDPEDVVPWARMISAEVSLHDYEAMLAIGRRLLQLSPSAGYSHFVVSQALVLLAPPAASPTSVKTPLPPG